MPIGAILPPNDTLQQAKQTLAEAAILSEKLFDKGMAYNQALTLAGFGGLFALLAVTQSFMPKLFLAITAGMIGLSLLIYVGYVVFGMFLMSLAMLASAEKQLINVQKMQASASADTSDIEKSLSKLKSQIIIWLVVWTTSTASGFGAGIIMMFFYFKNILKLW